MSKEGGYANGSALVSTQWVSAHLNEPEIRLIEIDVDTSAYDSGHIPGAVGWNWTTDLQRQPIRDIPTIPEWERLLARSGINADSTVILYGDNNNWFAAFGYWLFKLYGFGDVRLMDGGRVKWLAESRPLSQKAPEVAATSYRVEHPRPDLRVLRGEVMTALEGGATSLVDVRSPAEFSGELLAPENLPQEGAQRGGHIPGAANVPWATAVDEDGTFKPVAALSAIYDGKGIDGEKPTIAYCRIGERSAHTWFVLHELLGYEDVRNYDGSWTEWGSVIGSPIER